MGYKNQPFRSYFKPEKSKKKIPRPLVRKPLNRKPRTNSGGFSLKKTKRKTTGELAVFKEIWEERPHKCELTDEPIRTPTVKNFMHGWAKGCVKKYRNDKRNIFLVAEWVHDEYDCRGRTNPIFEKVREMVALLKLEYHSNKHES